MPYLLLLPQLRSIESVHFLVLTLGRRRLSARHGSARPLARPCISLGSLAADRQPADVSNAAIAADVFKPFNVIQNLSPQIALNGEIVQDHFGNPARLFFGEVSNP